MAQEKNIRNRIFLSRLADLMKKTGTTQVQLADAIDTTQPTISRYLEGTLPKADALLALSQFFGVPMEYFLGEQVATVASVQAPRGDKHKQLAARLRALADELDPPEIQNPKSKI